MTVNVAEYDHSGEVCAWRWCGGAPVPQSAAPELLSVVRGLSYRSDIATTVTTNLSSVHQLANHTTRPAQHSDCIRHTTRECARINRDNGTLSGGARAGGRRAREPLKQKPQLVAPEPEHCPGPESQQAGTADSCAGCPNQAICASAPKGPDPDIPVISARLADVKHKILVLSGKGGVGKSTFTSLLAHAFATNPDSTVGIMDTDICGPSIPKMMGVEDETIHVSGSGWSPVWVMDNLGVMSIQFMLPNRDDAVIWRGPKKNGLIKQFLKDVEWGEMDFLLVDTPPGTSDEHLSVNSFLKESGIDGAVVVTTPQEVSLLDVRKEIDFCRKAGIRVLGIAENMSGFVCPSCKGESQIFRPTTGGGRALAEEMGVPFLGAVHWTRAFGWRATTGRVTSTRSQTARPAWRLKRWSRGWLTSWGWIPRMCCRTNKHIDMIYATIPLLPVSLRARRSGRGIVILRDSCITRT